MPRPNIIFPQFIYTIEVLEDYLVVKDARPIETIRSYYKIADASNIDEETSRIVFSAKRESFLFEPKELKKGILKLVNSDTQDYFLISFLDKNGADYLNSVILNINLNPLSVGFPAVDLTVADLAQQLSSIKSSGKL